MAFKKLTDHIDDVNENVQAYVSSMLEYYKLDFFKKATKGSSKLVKLLVFGSIFLFFLGFISLGVAFWIGNCLGHLSYGFFIVGGIYLIAFLLFLAFGSNMVDNLILKKFSKTIFNDPSSQDVIDEPFKDEMS